MVYECNNNIVSDLVLGTCTGRARDDTIILCRRVAVTAAAADAAAAVVTSISRHAPPAV